MDPLAQDEETNRRNNKAYDCQKRRIDKLMLNPEKLVVIPEPSSMSGKQFKAPDFVRNVMGSSAGAGSGEFHVYRHLRRQEQCRLKDMEVSDLERQDREERRQKLEENKTFSEEKTLKRRLKRLKKKKNKQDKSTTTTMKP